MRSLSRYFPDSSGVPSVALTHTFMLTSCEEIFSLNVVFARSTVLLRKDFSFHLPVSACRRICFSVSPHHFFLLARPTDTKTIDCVIQIGEVLSSDTETVKENTIGKGELLDSIMAILEMTEAELTQYVGRSILSTARQIVETKYPGEDVVFANAKKDRIKAIVGQ